MRPLLPHGQTAQPDGVDAKTVKLQDTWRPCRGVHRVAHSLIHDTRDLMRRAARWTGYNLSSDLPGVRIPALPLAPHRVSPMTLSRRTDHPPARTTVSRSANRGGRELLRSFREFMRATQHPEPYPGRRKGQREPAIHLGYSAIFFDRCQDSWLLSLGTRADRGISLEGEREEDAGAWGVLQTRRRAQQGADGRSQRPFSSARDVQPQVALKTEAAAPSLWSVRVWGAEAGV